MNPNNKNQLFRLSAVLYADNNYDISSKTTLRKIIETGLFAIEEDSVNIHKVIDFIFENYNLHIGETELIEIVSSHKQDSFIINFTDEKQVLSLTEKRKKLIQSKLNENTIEHFIDLYFAKESTPDISESLKKLIYRFLYDILSSNVESFKKLIDKDNTIEALINVDNHSYTPEERELINDFLKWDNIEKNKSIFDIASFAIEYCLISNHSKQGLDLKNLKNKTFYLDTNVLFRVLGINGKDRKKRSLTFLERFQDSKTELLISKYTDKEFKNTIDYYLQRLTNKPFKNEVNPSLFKNQYFKSLKDIYNFYYNWRIGKQNHSLDLFKADILAKYQEFCSKMNITIDYKNVLKEDDKNIDEVLTDYVSSINSHKSTLTSTGNLNAFEIDAKNILLIENLRGTNNNSIFDTKTFFLSMDQSLRRWDFNRGNSAPLIIIPSQWMSLLLRYQTRSTDDFKSFVSFLNLPIPEKQVSSENIHNVLAGISEVTSNFDQQSFIAEQLVLQGFEKIIQKSKDVDELFNLTIEASEGILEKKLKELEEKQEELAKSSNERIQKLENHNESKESKIEQLKGKQEKLVESTNQKIVTLEGSITTKNSIIDEKDLEIEKLKIEKYSSYEKEELKKFKRPAFLLYIPLSIILAIFALFCFTFQNKDWNLIKDLINSVDNETSSTRQWMFKIFISIIISTGLIGLIKASYSRLAKHKIKDYADKVKARYSE